MAEPHSPEDILDGLGAVMARWATGGNAAALAPSPWVELIGSDPTDAELRLLALSGQLLEVAIALPTTETGALALKTLPDLPRLAFATTSDALRPQLRRIRREVSAADWNCLIHLIAARGFTIHPADWLPAAGNSDIPDVYAPWRDWAEIAGGTTSGRSGDADELNAETWDLFYPAERTAAFKSLRKTHPEKARALLEARLAGEDATRRLALVECLSAGLSSGDLPFLATLSTADRAPKVKAQAVQFLARLGHAPSIATSAEDASELADYFMTEQKAGFKLKPLKTTAQKNRRAQLLSATDFAGLATSLGLSPSELAQAWPFASDLPLDQIMVDMALHSAPDDIVAILARGAIGNIEACIALCQRLEPEVCTEVARAMLDKGQTFRVAAQIAGVAFHTTADGGIDHPLRLPAGVSLMAEFRVIRKLDGKNDRESETEAKSRRNQVSHELIAIGLTTSCRGARETLDFLKSTDLLPTLRGLTDMIELNAAIEANTGKHPQ